MNQETRTQRIVNLVRVTATAWGIDEQAIARVEARLESSRTCRSRPALRSPRPGRAGRTSRHPAAARRDPGLPCDCRHGTAPHPPRSRRRQRSRTRCLEPHRQHAAHRGHAGLKHRLTCVQHPGLA